MTTVNLGQEAGDKLVEPHQYACCEAGTAESRPAELKSMICALAAVFELLTAAHDANFLNDLVVCARHCHLAQESVLPAEILVAAPALYKELPSGHQVFCGLTPFHLRCSC